MTEYSSASIASQLRPGEKIIWSGRPEYKAGTSSTGSSPLVKPALYLVAIAAAVWVFRDKLPGGAFEQVLGGLSNGQVIGIIGAILIVFVLPVVARRFKFDNQSRLDRYFLSHEYAITDQRLVIAENGDISSYGPEDLPLLKVRDRGNGLGDVQFFRRTHHSQSNVRDPVASERERIGFKLLREPEAIKRRIEQWVAERVSEAGESTEAFTASPEEEGQRFHNPRLGLGFIAPKGWDIRVRKKKEPYGAKFLDKENWRSIADSNDWNTVRIEGPLGCQVEFELFETEPMVTYKGMSKSRLIRMLAGKPVESDPDFELAGMPGFQLTYRNNLVRDKERRNKLAGVSAAAQMSRIHVLHDGRHQLYIITRWPEGSEELGETVDRIARSIVVK